VDRAIEGTALTNKEIGAGSSCDADISLHTQLPQYVKSFSIAASKCEL
jgi:hypothetical protein